ncbi:P-loop containing nucleoside triphosphatehydrolases superfamily protein [Striga asiatica]|uniref:P-loop containing nucleoside triphosphatehydrolases superfamily protein n=1 Tax=Striga asiatica TaxID=4170 RepID=A0A5A7R997_STRAF|nr:P-loop containing nucleoside triphosphatehydrolases superfamily protein [Striga asiatica]
MKALDQEVKSDCGSVDRKTGPDDDALATSFEKQAVSDTDMFEEELKSGSISKRKVELDNASFPTSVAKKPATSDAGTSDVVTTIGHDEEVDMDTDYLVLDNAPPVFELKYWTTLDTNDDDLKDELAKHFDRGSDQFRTALDILGGHLHDYKARFGGDSDHPGGGNEVKSGSTSDCGSLNRKTGPDDDALAASFENQEVSGTDMLEEELKSGSTSKRKVELDDASFPTSVAKKPATSDAGTSDDGMTFFYDEDEEEEDVDMVTDFGALDNDPPLFEIAYWTTLDTKDEDLKDELAKHFDRGSDQFKTALKSIGDDLYGYKAQFNGDSDHRNGGKVFVKATLRHDGSVLLSIFS